MNSPSLNCSERSSTATTSLSNRLVTPRNSTCAIAYPFSPDPAIDRTNDLWVITNATTIGQEREHVAGHQQRGA